MNRAGAAPKVSKRNGAKRTGSKEKTGKGQPAGRNKRAAKGSAEKKRPPVRQAPGRKRSGADPKKTTAGVRVSVTQRVTTRVKQTPDTPQTEGTGDDDRRLAIEVDRAVRFIAAKDRSLASALEDIGDYLITHFFSGDVERVSSHNPRKGFSLRLLAEHKGMTLSRSSLQRCMALAAQRIELGAVPALGQLSTTHRMILLGEPETAQKKVDIRRIVKEGLSTREYAALVKKRHQAPLTEREAEHPALPPHVSRARAALNRITADAIRALSPARRREATLELREMKQYIDGVLQELNTR